MMSLRTALTWLVTILAAALPLCMLYGMTSVETFGYDTAQHLSGVRSLLQGRGFQTSVGWFESQLAMPLPLPQTVWPPAFAMLSAAVALAPGVDGPAEAMIAVVYFAYAATALLIALSCRLLGLALPAALAMALTWLYFIPAWINMVQVGAEPLCEFAITFALFAFLNSQASGGRRTAWLVAAGAGATLAVMTRYQAIVIVPALALLPLCCAPKVRWRAMARDLMICCGGPAIVFCVMLFRNYRTTGLLTGGAQSPLGRTWPELASSTLWLPEHLRTAAFAALCASALAALALGLASIATVRGSFGLRWASVLPPTVAAAIAYAGLLYSVNVLFLLALAKNTTVYSLELRYLTLPLPAIIVAVAGLGKMLDLKLGTIHRFTGLIVMIALVLAAAPSALFHSQFIRMAKNLPGVRLQPILESTRFDGGSLLHALKDGDLRCARLMSNMAQPLSLFTDATVLGISGSIYNRMAWSESEVRGLTYRQDVDVLLIFKDAQGSALDFLAQRLAMVPDADWYLVESSTPDLFIARVKSVQQHEGVSIPRQPEQLSCEARAN